MMAIETSAVQYGSNTRSMKLNNVVVVIVQTRLTNLLNVINKVFKFIILTTAESTNHSLASARRRIFLLSLVPSLEFQ